MSLQRAIDRFLVELRKVEEGETVIQAQIFSDNRNPNPLSNLIVDEASSSNTIPQSDNIRELTERMELVEREVPCLVQRLLRLQRHLASVTVERDKLREEVDRFKENAP